MKFQLSSFLFTALLVPSTEVKGACTWEKFPNKSPNPDFAAGDSAYYPNLAAGQAACLQLGTDVCKGVTCVNDPNHVRFDECTVRANEGLGPHGKLDTYQPSADCPTDAEDQAAPTIDKNQVLPVGTGEVGSPYGTVTLTPGTIGGLVIETYFEASKYQFENNAISIEVYSGVEEDEDDCTQGNLVNKLDVGGNTVYTSETLSTGTVQLNGATSDGVVGIARVTFTDFTADLTEWDPNPSKNVVRTDTQYQACNGWRGPITAEQCKAKCLNNDVDVDIYIDIVPIGTDCVVPSDFQCSFLLWENWANNQDGLGSWCQVYSSEASFEATTKTSELWELNDTPSPIWFPDDKQVKLCVVTSIKMDYDKTATGDGTDGGVATDAEYTVNHMDSKRTISIDLTADIGPQAVDITQSIATNSDMDAVLEIPVDSFLCNNKYEEVTNRLYTVGRNFRVCVRPRATGYIVDNYIELTCGDRPLITTDAMGATTIDPLTEIDSDFITAGVLALRSVITAEDVLLALALETDGNDGKVQFTCTGKVSLSYTAPIRGRALRDLQTSTEVAVPSGAGGGAEELLEGLFELKIEMDIPSNESSAKPLPSSMTTTVAVIGFGSILSVVSSMMW